MSILLYHKFLCKKIRHRWHHEKQIEKDVPNKLEKPREMWKKTSVVLPNVRFEAYPSQKNCGIRGIYEKPSLQPKKKHSLNWIGKRLLHPLTAYKSPGFQKPSFFCQKNHRFASAFGSHGPFFFFRSSHPTCATGASIPVCCAFPSSNFS